jgi:hypothetical protein
MRKSKKRNPHRRRQTNKVVKLPKKEQKSNNRFLSFVQYIIKVAVFLGAVGGAAKTWEWGVNEVSEPEIHANSGQVGDPFALRFSVRNASSIFALTDVRITCHILNLRTNHQNRVENVVIAIEAPFTSVPPGASVQYNCPFRNAIRIPDEILIAQVSIEVENTLAGIKRTKMSGPMTWTAQSGQWIEGQLVN